MGNHPLEEFENLRLILLVFQIHPLERLCRAISLVTLNLYYQWFQD
jgi:hypothetical protein